MNTTVTKRQPDRRLAKQIHMPGGRRVDDIEADVAARLEALREACLAEVGEHIALIVRLGQEPSRPRTEPELEALYLRAKDVVGLSGVAGLDHVGEACHSLCRLVDGFRNGKAWNPAAFQVHIQSIQILAQAGAELTAEIGRSTITGLAGVVDKALRQAG